MERIDDLIESYIVNVQFQVCGRGNTIGSNTTIKLREKNGNPPHVHPSAPYFHNLISKV
jgi:hypothetical protein